MRRSTWAALTAAVLVVGLSVVAALLPVPYVTFSPGPTVNVLGKYDGRSIITVDGEKSYRDTGGLRLTTIIPSGPADKISIPTLVTAWIDPDRAVYPYEAIYGTDDTRSSVRQQSAAQMTSSQENAVAAALKALKIGYDVGVGISLVQPDGPADGKLEVGDQAVDLRQGRFGEVLHPGSRVTEQRVEVGSSSLDPGDRLAQVLGVGGVQGVRRVAGAGAGLVGPGLLAVLEVAAAGPVQQR